MLVFVFSDHVSISVIGLAGLCSMQLMTSGSMYQITQDLFAYFTLVYNMNKLLDVLFEWSITMESLQEANQYAAVIKSTDPLQEIKSIFELLAYIFRKF